MQGLAMKVDRSAYVGHPVPTPTSRSCNRVVQKWTTRLQADHEPALPVLRSIHTHVAQRAPSSLQPHAHIHLLHSRPSHIVLNQAPSTQGEPGGTNRSPQVTARACVERVVCVCVVVNRSSFAAHPCRPGIHNAADQRSTSPTRPRPTPR